MQNDPISKQSLSNYRPTTAYIGATWTVLGVGVISFLFGLWNATGLALSEKGFYLAVIALGLYSAISLQKTVRDKAQGIPTSSLYYSISWAALGLSVILILVGLFNATGLSLTEKSFYMMAFTLSLFAAITIQKNTRDNAQINALQSAPIQAQLTPADYDSNDYENNDTSDKRLFGSLRAKSKGEDLD